MIYLASKTYKAINDTMVADQGASFRQWEQKVLPAMADAYRGVDNPFRNHMGASGIGDECGRKIWYNWRWLTRPTFEGRILRLFNRGHLEEARFISMLLMIGVQVYQHDENGKQFGIKDVAGHYGGSGDGVAIGLPDLSPGIACLLEFKTHGEKSFVKLVKEGVRESKPEHYVQMNQYMGKMGLGVALYGAVNKNTDEIHLELIAFDRANYEEFLDRAHKIVWLKQPPKRINESPGFFLCKWCDHQRACHELPNNTADRNCRTCINSQPFDDGQMSGAWRCNRHNKVLTQADQLAACNDYQRAF